MRWDHLFDDLEGQAAAADAEDEAAEVADRSRLEAARLTLVDRARSTGSGDVALGLVGGRSIRGSLAAVGADWIVLHQGAREVLVPAGALCWLRPEGPHPAAVAPGELSAAGVPAELSERTDLPRLGFGYALRRLARDRTQVVITLRDSTSLSGIIDRVGADHVDLVEQPLDGARRSPEVRAGRLVAFAAVACVDVPFGQGTRW